MPPDTSTQGNALRSQRGLTPCIFGSVLVVVVSWRAASVPRLVWCPSESLPVLTFVLDMKYFSPLAWLPVADAPRPAPPAGGRGAARGRRGPHRGAAYSW